MAMTTMLHRDTESSVSANETFSRSTPVEQLPQFLSVNEFARYVGIGRSLAYEMVRTDTRLRTVRFRKLLRITRESLLALAKEQA